MGTEVDLDVRTGNFVSSAAFLVIASGVKFISDTDTGLVSLNNSGSSSDSIGKLPCKETIVHVVTLI